MNEEVVVLMADGDVMIDDELKKFQFEIVLVACVAACSVLCNVWYCNNVPPTHGQKVTVF